MAKEIILAENAGFCFGVKRAVDMATQFYDIEGLNVKTLGPLIHNNDVIKRLEEHGIDAISLEQVESLGKDDVVVVRSHGIAPQIYEQIARTQAEIVDATCPYVATIHKKVTRHHQMGYQIVIVGDPNHPEVIGINGCCENTAVITRDANELPEFAPDQKVCVVAQTTERLENFEKVLAAVESKCKDVEAFNTICSATKTRQESAAAVAQKVDVMIVIGGRNSSNTKKLVEISKAHCSNTIHIENSSELPLELIEDAKNQLIGITAGASTPDWVIEDVIERIKSVSK
jgi:(E)-4-hydroxy-3-methyl-but-2-enyl pyrophosphate reductase